MQLRFKKQQYQAEATNSLVDVFAGQQKGNRKEVVGRSGFFVEEIFSNKKLTLDDVDILQNIQEVQKRNNLNISKKLEKAVEVPNLTVEMETGTGKTYVYTKMMFEMNRKYGWNKFIIMVPSVAIREGVYKSLKITTDHFQEEYGKKLKFFIYNTKNKSNLVNIKSFASSSSIEVIVMNYQAFGRRGKDHLKMFQELDVLQSKKPIDVIKRARPILIIDEPQKFGPAAEDTLKEFSPLFITRFSATHKNDYNKVYRLDAIDAYNEKLVKKIKVIGIDVDSATGANSFLFLDKINIFKNKYPTASIHLEIEVKGVQGIKKSIKTFKEGDNLFEHSGLEQYRGYVIKEINGYKNIVSFTNGVEIGVGQVHGDVDEKHLRRIQIRETIKSHIEKERELFKKGIKVLSLFFIDEVAKYREYNEAGNKVKSEYEKIFEEEYKNIISKRELFDKEYGQYLDKFEVNDIHNGYFSIDKKGRAVDSKEVRGNGSDDVDAYDLIMKHKEKLLSFDEPTRFIFSHSALREGWDNPNIFQICTLKHSQTTIGKRQEIGRGLRISVDNNGNRMDESVLGAEFFDINNLTVVASESYENFAKTLQKEIFESLSDRPVELTLDVLINKVLKNEEGKEFRIDNKTATKIILSFTKNGYINSDFKVTENFIEAVEKKEVELIDEIKGFENDFLKMIQKIYYNESFSGSENQLNENIPKELKTNSNFAKKEFQDLWNKIKVKTAYTVDFDDNELIKKSIQSIDKNLVIKKINIVITEGEQKDKMNSEDLNLGSNLISIAKERELIEKIETDIKYDLVGKIANEAILTRDVAVKILKGINKNSFAKFKANPEDFITKVVKLIQEQKAVTLINQIKYSKTKQEYTDDIFTINNFSGSLEKNVLEVKKHVYDYVKTDSDVERKFAKDMENENDIMIYAKLPHKFKIPTPVGSYNPDWAIVFNTKKIKYIYFIAETKGSMATLQLKGSEDLKIQYARKHFKLLEKDNIKYDVIDNYDSLVNKLMK
jgi:type III restriction enzyme